MNIVQLTPGAGGMYCGNCFRDHALVTALRTLGHSTLMVPLYLPLTLEETELGARTPIFFGGVSVYLEQKAAFFRTAPRWLHDLLAAPALLKWVGRFAAKTRPEDVGELTLSMLRGEQGNQARELDELIAWLKTQPKPDLICLSNCLLIGLARRLRSDLGAPIACMMQGEESFLDALPLAQRAEAWRTLAERARETDLLVAPSRYYAERMSERLRLPAERIRVIHNGISLAGYDTGQVQAPNPPTAAGPVLGYLTRMCPEKGLDTLVEAFILLKQQDRIPGLRLRVAGGCGPSDEPFVNRLRDRLRANGLLGEAEFCPNLSRTEKIAFLRSLSVFSVPALYGEAFGLYLLEAWAAGVPVVQPRHAAFPELVAATGGGVLCAPGDPSALAAALEPLLLDPALAQSLGAAGQTAVRSNFSAAQMARSMMREFIAVTGCSP